MSTRTPEGWQRLHPLSPVVRGGRATTACLLRPDPDQPWPRLAGPRGAPAGVVALDRARRCSSPGSSLAGGSRTTTCGSRPGCCGGSRCGSRWRRFRRSTSSGRGWRGCSGVAELRLRMAGSSGATARLAYVAEHEVEPLRDQLLALARGARHDEAAPDAARREPAATAGARPRDGPERAARRLDPARELVAGRDSSSDPGRRCGLAAHGRRRCCSAAASSGRSASSTFVWRRFNQQYRLTVAEGPDGLHLRGGLVALTAEVIRPGRVQAVRLVEPLLWRPLGWCRLEVDLAGRQRRKGEGEAQRGQLRALLPVGDALARDRARRSPPARPAARAVARRRAASSGRARSATAALSWGRNDTCVATTSGRLRRVTCWVPLEKVQSLRHVQGPVQRRLRLASVHVDTAGRAVHATLRDRDAAEAARRARRAHRSRTRREEETRADVKRIGGSRRGVRDNAACSRSGEPARGPPEAQPHAGRRPEGDPDPRPLPPGARGRALGAAARGRVRQGIPADVRRLPRPRRQPLRRGVQQPLCPVPTSRSSFPSDSRGRRTPSPASGSCARSSPSAVIVAIVAASRPGSSATPRAASRARRRRRHPARRPPRTIPPRRRSSTHHSTPRGASPHRPGPWSPLPAATAGSGFARAARAGRRSTRARCCRGRRCPST